MKRVLIALALTGLFAALIPQPARAQAGGAVLNRAGVPVKLITTRATRLHAEPSAGSDSSPVAIFKFWYVLPPDKTAPSRKQEDIGELSRNGFYRVASGDSESEFRGWIPAADAIEWHHRQAVKFAPLQGREPAHFFTQPKEAEAAAGSGDVAAATHREPQSTGGELIVMPVLGVDDVTVDGQGMELYELAFVAGRPETEPQATPNGGVQIEGVEGVVTPQRVRDESTVDVVFVVDTTASMQPAIDQVRRSIESVARRLSSDPGIGSRLRLGLVAYRDAIPDMSAMEYVSRVFCNLDEGSDHHVFLQRLSQLREAPVGSVDYPEDGLAGIAAAMDLAALRWKPFAWKNIVVVGDASWKNPDHPKPESRRNEGNRTLAGVLATAQPGTEVEALTKAGFMFYAVRVEHPDGQEDHPYGQQQANTLIAGRDYNGRAILASGGASPQDFSGQLAEQILERLGNHNAVVVQGQDVPTPASPAASARGAAAAADFPWPVLEILRQVGSVGNGTGGMHFDRRFSAEFDADGNRVFVPHLFVRKGELLSFTSMLDFLQGQLEDAGEPGNRDVTAILKGLQTLSATLNISEPITADMPVERFLTVLLGFPIKNPIFQLTLADLAAMSQTDYDDWVQSVKAQKDALGALTENPHIWRKLHRDAGERDAHAFVPLSDLP